MLILRPAWLHPARQPYLVSVTPAGLGIFLAHVCVSRLFCVCKKKKKREKKKWCVQLVLADFSNSLRAILAVACRRGRIRHSIRDEVPSSGAEVAVTGGEPGSWQVSGDEGRKEVVEGRRLCGGEREREEDSPSSGAFFWGCSLYILLFCFLLLLSALIVALRQKSRPQEPAAQTFETEATLASKPALNYLSFLFSISS